MADYDEVMRARRARQAELEAWEARSNARFGHPRGVPGGWLTPVIGAAAAVWTWLIRALSEDWVGDALGVAALFLLLFAALFILAGAGK